MNNDDFITQHAEKISREQHNAFTNWLQAHVITLTKLPINIRIPQRARFAAEWLQQHGYHVEMTRDNKALKTTYRLILQKPHQPPETISSFDFILKIKTDEDSQS